MVKKGEFYAYRELCVLAFFILPFAVILAVETACVLRGVEDGIGVLTAWLLMSAAVMNAVIVAVLTGLYYFDLSRAQRHAEKIICVSGFYFINAIRPTLLVMVNGEELKVIHRVTCRRLNAIISEHVKRAKAMRVLVTTDKKYYLLKDKNVEKGNV